MHKTILFSIFTLLFANLFAAETKPSADSSKTPVMTCQAAKDSVKKRTSRGEISFYNTIKYVKDQYYFVTIDKNSYKRTITKKGNPGEVYLSCYNKASQKMLDSIYKGDFFRMADSILASYDKTGRGYRNADFPGGAPALQKFMEKNVSLPKDTKPDDTGKLIRVYYSFIVDEKGTISDIQLAKSNCKGAEAAVLEAVKKLPPFSPATDAGKPKKVKYILPYMKKQ